MQLGEHIHSLLLDIQQEEQLQDYRVGICLPLVENVPISYWKGNFDGRYIGVLLALLDPFSILL
jgi:hypothetical protein